MKKHPSIILALIIFITSLTMPVSADGVDVNRIYGDDPYHTSALVSESYFESADSVIIASGDSYPDSLVAGVLAGYEEAPLLMVEQDQIPWPVESEIRRLDPDYAYVIRGEATISPQVEDQLNDLGLDTYRLSGPSRYDTALDVKEEITSYYDVDPAMVFYADGRNFPDALAAVPLVVRNNGVLLLNDGTALNEGIAIGGDRSIPGRPDQRISGTDRYATSVEIASYSDTDKALVVDGSSFAEPLLASVVGAIEDADVILTDSQDLPDVVEDFIPVYNYVTILGDTDSVSGQIEKDIENILIEKITIDPIIDDPIIDQESRIYKSPNPLVNEAVRKFAQDPWGTIELVIDRNPSISDLEELSAEIINIMTTDNSGSEAFIYFDGIDIHAENYTPDQPGKTRISLTSLPLPYGVNKKGVDEFVTAWVGENISPTMSDYDKALAIFDFVVEKANYVEGTNPTYSDSVNSQGVSVYIPESILFSEGGVCEAYAKLFYLLAKESGLDVRYITGIASGVGHAWNTVEIDGQWYYLDATWADTDEGTDYSYFLYTDSPDPRSLDPLAGQPWIY